jgi:hypothetical protein
MKICKNKFDIILYPVARCSECGLDTHMRPCLWLKLYGKATLDCGGVKTNILSDIFKL